MSFTLRRTAARVVLLAPDDRVLLLRGSDPADPTKGSWWEIPGGGIDPHETSEQAARRELREEAGVHDAEVGPCVWVQHSRFRFGGFHFDQFEHIHVAWCDAVTDAWRPEGLEPLEALAFSGQRWWGVDELLASDDRLLPVRLREVLPDLVGGHLPCEPIDITATGWPEPVSRPGP